MKNRTFFFFLTVATLISIILPNALLAQTDSDLELFEGGKIDLTMRFRSSLLLGPGLQGAFTGFTAPVNPDPFIVFGNPAALTRVGGNRVAIGFAPAIEAEITDVNDPVPTVVEETDAALESFTRTGRVRYPEVSGRVGYASSPVKGLALVLQTDKSQETWFGSIPRLFDYAGIGYYRPIYLEMSTVFTGMRLRMRTQEETPEDEILFYASMKMNIDAQISADSWAMTLARDIGSFGVGVGFTRTDIGINFTGQSRTDGIMSMGGNESAFNDPNDPWDNDYYTTSSGQLEGSCWGIRLGGTYNTVKADNPNKGFLFGVDLRLQTAAEMDGPLEFSVFNFKALNLNAEGDESKFDVNRIQDVSELTRTYETVMEVPNPVMVDVPGSFSFAMSWVGFPHPTLTYTKYFGELSYQVNLVEDGVMSTYKRGFKPDWAALLGMNLGHFYLAGGMTQLAEVVEGYEDTSGIPIAPMESTIVPRLSVGFDWSIAENITFGTLVFGLPEDMIQFTLKIDL